MMQSRTVIDVGGELRYKSVAVERIVNAQRLADGKTN